MLDYVRSSIYNILFFNFLYKRLFIIFVWVTKYFRVLFGMYLCTVLEGFLALPKQEQRPEWGLET